MASSFDPTWIELGRLREIGKSQAGAIRLHVGGSCSRRGVRRGLRLVSNRLAPLARQACEGSLFELAGQPSPGKLRLEASCAFKGS